MSRVCLQRPPYLNVDENGSVPNLACMEVGRLPLTGSGMSWGAGYDGPPDDCDTRQNSPAASGVVNVRTVAADNKYPGSY